MSTQDDVHLLREAIRLTREYVGEPMLPALEGWTWFDAIAATGGFDGFGGCGSVLDPWEHGRTRDGALLYCNLPAAHEGDHGRVVTEPTEQVQTTPPQDGRYGADPTP